MTDDPPSIDWNNPIPGNTPAIRGEIERLRDLGEQCREGARLIRRLDLYEWRGSAAERFDSIRISLARQWEDAEDAHVRAVDALVEYRGVLLIVQPLARTAVERATRDGDWTRAQVDIERWRRQRDEAARKAADALHDAANSLRSLPVLLPEEPTQPDHAQSVGLGPSRVAAEPEPEPAARHQSPAMQYERAKSLCDAILDAEFVSAEHL